MVELQEIVNAIINGQHLKVGELTQKALDEGKSVREVLFDGLIAGMSIIGDRFKKNEVYVPEVLIAARAMKAGMEVLKPLIAKAGIEPIGTFVIGTAKGDLHDIGKNLVCMMMEGAGFKVIDLGIDVSPEKFVSAINENKPNVIGISALLTTTMPAMKDTIEVLKSEGIRDKVKVIIGGAPVTQSYADEIGADGYAADASSAVDKVKELMGIA